MADTNEKLIFVLEDDDSQRDLITILLEDEDYLVEGYPNVSSFRKRLERKVPQLIIMDVLLPDGNGIEVCKGIKQIAATSLIPIIMMSAHYDFSKESCPAQAFIAKPFDIYNFVHTVQYCLR